ncbi:hypothetical protein CEUSTIGMA_g9822.t1 [Chlamydomonas eustigma]|uniref:Proteasome subunit beta n=1 Tax=Chlamydomonas eustigma TaxID=1157962 RepID=A0A250XH36_9CHLO|nr:hypothetical protein CEUSTIGMA_g9822.t1 [Chlamydomonas eustigma]|eukprot:GAX82394.1 hypothetical protein CEUSTIGMA_g9822.t1 [Chlamydomonas eustigma]
MIPRPQSHSHALGPGVTGPELLVPTSALLERPPAPTPLTPSCGGHAFMVDPLQLHEASSHGDAGGPRQHTKYPYVTGTSVIGIKYKDGVMIAADTLAAYGSTKRYKTTQRVVKVNNHTILGAGGEISDFQHIQTVLNELTDEDYRMDDGIEQTPSEVYAYLGRVMYNRRNKFNPLWNSLVVGGVQPDGMPFLGMVAMQGTHYVDSHVATGFASQLARPLFRERQHDDMSEEDALALIHDALKVCYYRDKQSINKFQVAKATASGITITEPFCLDVKWDYELFKQPTKWAVGAW